LNDRKGCAFSAPSFRRGAAAVVAAGLLLTAAACAGTKETTASLLLMHPIPPEANEYTMVAGAERYEHQGLSVELRPLDPRHFDRSLVESGRKNPFGVAPDDARHPLVFGLTVANGGTGMVYVNPAQVRGVDDLNGRHYPVSFTDLWQMLAEDPDREARFKVFSSAFLDTPVQVQPGQTLKVFLALSRTAKEPERITVTLPLSMGGKLTRTLAFPFEVFFNEE
jgi:hypothetical protein